jgi:hypothetical protein
MAETRRSRADIKLDEKCCADCIIYRVCITLISLPHKKNTAMSQNAFRCDSPRKQIQDIHKRMVRFPFIHH